MTSVFPKRPGSQGCRPSRSFANTFIVLSRYVRLREQERARVCGSEDERFCLTCTKIWKPPATNYPRYDR
ncbi:hypothetical protein E2C01_035316 [Portunus trituberculatus]|uniref:Uncharacterized protein n=1 Tax=Portunus trituberculatus TaxID=210409 RepID=A0A5B7F808_PORTR|nr:hypothetical protein [Portunus trituberculatus]